MKPVIDVRNVWKIYKLGKVDVPALRGLSIKIYPKDFVVIMGPSGSGKSTAMNIIGCLDYPTKGSVYLDNQDISHLSESKLAKIRGQKIGFVFQEFNLIKSLSAIENVMLPMIFQNKKEGAKERAEALLTSLGLGQRMSHRPTELSGGEQQRVAIARALANDPEIILADEPTGNLDSKTSEKIMELLYTLHEKDKKTIVVVTHDPMFAKLRREKLYILKDGRINNEKS